MTKNTANTTITKLLLLNVRDLLRQQTCGDAHSQHSPRSWIEANFQKRDCVKFIPNPKDDTKCCCGQARQTHPTIPGIEPGSPGDDWLPNKHTRPHPTDAYGTIEFQGGAHPTKAQYVRLSYDTRPELLVQLFTREWNLELPKLLITVQGGKANFELQPKLKKEIRKGLLKAAKTTGAWVFTGGTNTGVTKQVGDALLLEGQQRTGRVVSIGIAPWGIVERNHELLGHNRDVPCHSISSPRSKLAVLNNRHAYFLLVDNGTQGKYGAELILRRKLEKFISSLKLHPFTHSSTPVVCLVIEGGTNTIRAVLEYVTDTPPVPVVVCDGSGRAADLIAFVHKYASDGEEQTVLESMRDYLLNMIQKTFEVGIDQAECLYHELLLCTRNKNLITVYRIQEKPEGETQELDQTILTALFKSQHLSPPEQLSLALTWNRVDIAACEIFVYGQEWPHGALDDAMMQALEHDRIDFVKLLLENGVSMKKFLTIPRLEELYNTKHGPANTLGYILRDVRPHIPKGYVYTLHDIGLVINKLMGGAYRSYYTRRKFRPIYAKVMNSYVNTHRKSSTFQRHPGANSMSLVTGLLPFTSEMALFEFPFNELLIWAVLTKRQEMSVLMWAHGEESLAKSLVACKLYKAMAHEAAEDDLDTEIYDELKSYAKDFEMRGVKLLDYCYRCDAERAQRLLTCELHSWSNQSCLSLAVAANHRALLAHPCSQVILADLWMGGLRTRKNTNLKVILGLLCPPFIKRLDFKSKEELQQMPQTEEEHLENQNLDYEDQDKHPDAEALLADTYAMKATKVQENGKVSLTDADACQKEFAQLSHDFEIRHHQPLRLKKKIYEFYTAPITKFWADSIAYMMFLMLFSYTVLVRMGPAPTWQEAYSIAYITTLGCEKVREVISSEPVAITQKFQVWAWNMWNPCDALAIIFFLIGLSLRFQPAYMDVGRVIYCVDSIYWYLRILNILGVNKYLGPLVTMMGKMVKNMIYFVVLLLVVLLSFGVSRQSILFPNEEASWRLIRDVYFQPYFMLYGEVFAGEIDPPCGVEGHPPCITGHWVTPITMSMYLLIANILLINLLIAVFNNIFIEVNAVSHQVWMFQRFTVVMEYQQKPVLPPPFIAFSHFYSLMRYLIRKARGREWLDIPRDNGLKLFLEKEDMERLYDFEEECVEGYFRETEIAMQQSTDERIKSTNERVENMSQKVEDINQKENLQSATVQTMDFRLRKMEESTDQILSTLAVIHRFMSAHTTLQDSMQGSAVNVHDNIPMRLRTVSETENTTHLNTSNQNRKRFNRSLTEVRPDAYIFDDGLHFEVRTVHEEDELLQSHETLNEQQLQQKPNSRKISLMSEDSDIFIANKIFGGGGGGGGGAGGATAVTGSVPIETTTKPPYLNIQTRQGTTSTESKDTLTPIEPHEAAIEAEAEDEDGSTENIMELNFEMARQKAMRRRSMGRRLSSECCSNYDLNRSQTSLNATLAMSRRQLSLTQSEPDSGNELTGGPVKSAVIPIKSNRQMLLQFHSEYTSITDELENVCQMITSPTLSISRENEKSRSNAEFAALLEKKHLHECEENDYLMLSKLFQNRDSINDSDDAFGDDNSSGDIPHKRMLRRETAVELPITPSKSTSVAGTSTEADGGGGVNSVNERTDRSSPILKRNLSGDPSHGRTSAAAQTYLLPSTSDPNHPRFRKSIESLPKNSSSDTEYSLQPYRVIKQSSNETNTSLTGSFNVDQSYGAQELSLDTNETSAHYTTVIENVDHGSGSDTASLNKSFSVPIETPASKVLRQQSEGGASSGCVGSGRSLRKQFSIDHSSLSFKVDSTPIVGAKINLKLPTISTIPATPTKTLSAVVSSSTSTDESKDERDIPTISTNVVQDEIAKLSSNINRSAEDENSSDPPIKNETMC
ncbi:transient receptor potential cation channel trpm isoform X6 [Sitodiplosis mosellana]|uniref:transient receptor potential cation channel trpm isoform X6 n=1 Tax=Sitodiplosis mosellana TaxID=263140 RepID=UPI0024443ACB|nr:transient receptor potential cation channel trpm isoform X6 [Sitodiplosis mosellana]XP_055320177.1 transient receptor potential cation channel trpm isoform X6 [Sitodiplosis mosellana]XP_055320178.1 transient receptor potential cation channel trpm isoform X6 [Sitodiplosis mosellana]